MSFYLVDGQGVTTKKDPDASHRYGVDVAGALNTGDTVSGVTIAAQDGITAAAAQYVGSVISARITGGTPGTTGSVTLRWTTTAGDVDDWTLYFEIEDA